MNLSKKYRDTLFPFETVREGRTAFLGRAPKKLMPVAIDRFTLEQGDSEWTFNSFDEAAHLYKEADSCSLVTVRDDFQFRVRLFARDTIVSIELPAREDILTVLGVFDRMAAQSRLTDKPKRITLGKTKRYAWTRFAAQVLEEAHTCLSRIAGSSANEVPSENYIIEQDDVEWTLPSLPEFLAECPRATSYSLSFRRQTGSLSVHAWPNSTRVAVELPSRDQIESVFRVFDRHADESRIPVSERPAKIFIGHGRDQQWRDLKDHLHEKHGFMVDAYEIGARAGFTIAEVLQDMMSSSTFAVLVLTGEDKDEDGGLHARENVIHEAGLFQGRLGFSRAVILLEKGCEEFSNIRALTQIRFERGHISSTFGEVLATVRRELRSRVHDEKGN